EMENLLKPVVLSSQEWHALITFYEAIGTHKLELLNDVLTADWLDLPPSPGQKPGPEGVKPILQGFIDAFPDLVATIEEVIGEEHRAAARVSLSGTHLGPLMGLPASGKYMTLWLHEFHTFREGRISVTRHMEDWMGLFRQIGALPSAL
ncbi:MAG TPA: ester cyclase, partial [Edaphobacter sp.]|nr:ester cyclase [Edaphobacter sp.]